MEQRLEIRLSGSGGQGMILAGIILAEAAILEGKNAIQSQSYGPEARGGASKAEVIISNLEIDFPKVTKPDVLLALTDEALSKYSGDLKSNGLIIIDTGMNEPETSHRVIRLPILETAQREIGRSIVANIVALGALVSATEAVSRASVETAVLGKVPKGTEDLNKKALHIGFELVQSSNANKNL